jgi:hypothetical protein
VPGVWEDEEWWGMGFAIVVGFVLIIYAALRGFRAPRPGSF